MGEVELGGHTIGRDQIVILWIAAANRDPARFEDPDLFDVHRSPNPHLSFGHSLHFCLGAPLARLEARIALDMLFDGYREIATVRDAPPEIYNPWTMVSAKHLPVEVRTS